MEDKSLVRYIIGASRIKYDTLDELIKNYPDLVGVNFSKQFEMCVMMVDAHSIFYRLYREKDLASIYADSETELIRDLVVGFMNVLGHYRRYFATRLHLDNDIFVSFNRKPCKYQRSLVPEYDDKHVKRYDLRNPDYGFINHALNKAWEFIISISAYLEGIYCIDLPGVDDWTTLTMAASPNSDRNLYINFSRSHIPLQLLSNSTTEIPSWYQLINKRDKSIFVSRKDALSKVVLADRKLIPHKLISIGDLPYLWAIGGCPEVSMGSTKYARSVGTAIRIANRHLDNGGYQLYNMSFQQFCEAIAPFTKKSAIELKSDIPKLTRRFQAMNQYLTSRALTNDQRLQIKTNLIDMFDQTELEKLNDTLARMGDSDPNLLEIENLNMSTAQ